jgi:hypothetical protein
MKPSVVSSGSATPTSAADQSRRANLVVALSPLIVGLILLLVPARFFDPMFSKPPDILGVPLGFVLLVIAAAWAAIGVAIVWRVRSSIALLLALVLFAAPAMIVVIFGPAIILIMQNLGA